MTPIRYCSSTLTRPGAYGDFGGMAPLGDFRGRPPSLPFSRAASTFSCDFDWPPRLAFRLAACAFISEVTWPARTLTAFLGWDGASVSALCLTNARHISSRSAYPAIDSRSRIARLKLISGRCRSRAFAAALRRASAARRTSTANSKK